MNDYCIYENLSIIGYESFMVIVKLKFGMAARDCNK